MRSPQDRSCLCWFHSMMQEHTGPEQEPSLMSRNATLPSIPLCPTAQHSTAQHSIITATKYWSYRSSHVNGALPSPLIASAAAKAPLVTTAAPMPIDVPKDTACV